MGDARNPRTTECNERANKISISSMCAGSEGISTALPAAACMPKEFHFGILPFCTHIHISGNVVGFVMASPKHRRLFATAIWFATKMRTNFSSGVCVCENLELSAAVTCPFPYPPRPQQHLSHQWISNEFLIVKKMENLKNWNVKMSIWTWGIHSLSSSFYANIISI